MQVTFLQSRLLNTGIHWNIVNSGGDMNEVLYNFQNKCTYFGHINTVAKLTLK